MIQVRDATTGHFYSEDDLVNGFTDCECVADPYKGLSCSVPTEGVGKYTCTSDHEVRYYCSTGNVVGFALSDDNLAMTRLPALYGSDGKKYAECLTTFTDKATGEKIQTRPVSGRFLSLYRNYNWLRCQLHWSANPRIGNFRFRYAKEHLGYSSSHRNDFLGSDGEIYNFQVRPRIDNINPSSGGTSGGTRVTIDGANLEGISDIRVGGVKCTRVTAEDDGLRATCITAAAPATCTHGDDPQDLVNCATYTSLYHIAGEFPLSEIYKRDYRGRPCATGCVSASDGASPRCDLIEEIGEVNQSCYVPDCRRYVKKYPGSPGIDYRYSFIAGVRSDARSYAIHGVNTFMVPGLPGGSFRVPWSSGSDIYSNAFYSKASRHHGDDNNYVDETTGFFKVRF